ncbi:MAG: PPC domain-containing protein [Pseudomonadota bacterium]
MSRSLRLLLLTAASLALPQIAFAQTADASAQCGPGALWAGADEASSELGALAEALAAEHTVSGGAPQTLAFSVSGVTDVRIESVASDFDGDPVVSLTRPDGAEIAFDDDGGGALNARIETTLTTGTYCASFGGFGDALFATTTRIGRTDHAAITEATVMVDEVVCTAETDAVALGGGLPVSTTASAGSAPFYRITLSEASPLSITANNPTADPVLRVFDGGGTQIGENDDFAGLNARIDFEDALPPGNYCISVSALSDNTAPIELTVSVFDETAYLEALYERGDTAPPLDGSFPVEDLGIAQTRLRTDIRVGDSAEWLVFEMPEPGLALVEAISVSDGDPRIALFDDFGRMLYENDDGGADLNSLIAAQLAPGQYLIAVTDLNGSEQRQTTRLGITRYVPAR